MILCFLYPKAFLNIPPKMKTKCYLSIVFHPFSILSSSVLKSLDPGLFKTIPATSSSALISFDPPNHLDVPVSQSREKDELDSHYRRDFITCDNQLLNGEMFLQVCSLFFVLILNIDFTGKLACRRLAIASLLQTAKPASFVFANCYTRFFFQIVRPNNFFCKLSNRLGNIVFLSFVFCKFMYVLFCSIKGSFNDYIEFPHCRP